ncbi:MAG: hypothetical protein ACKESC_00595 [Candidatus Hodgkinia cicadicola]
MIYSWSGRTTSHIGSLNRDIKSISSFKNGIISFGRNLLGRPLTSVNL